jgi:RNA polymerase sigma factor (sigma-70 family)
METVTHDATAAVRLALERDRDELVRFVRRRAGHLVDPDEVVQRVALRAIERATQLRDPARARAWLFRLARNVLADEQRSIGARVHDEPPAQDLEVAIEAEGEPCGCALTLSKDLKREYAEILTRVVIDEVPIVRIADELGLTAKNATVRLHRAREALRRRMAEHCGTTSTAACASCGCDERGCCALH